MNKCIICGTTTSLFDDVQFQYDYDYCHNCHFIKKNNQLVPSAEKKEYERHNNTLANDSYVKYWQDLIDNKFLKYLTEEKEILDFGSGPYPILQAILANQYDINIDIYDLYFAPNPSYQVKLYDVIFITEVIEHLVDPIAILEHLIGLLQKNGRIIIMTLFHSNNECEFNQWWYRRDPTHISFFNYTTFQWIADKLHLEIEYCDKRRIIILNKPI